MPVELIVKSKMDLQVLLRVIGLIRRVNHLLPLSSLLISSHNGTFLVRALFSPRDVNSSRISSISRKIAQSPGVLEVKVVRGIEDG